MKKIANFFYDKTNLIVCITFIGIMVTYASLVLGGKSACFQDQLPEGTKVLGLKTGYTFDYALTLFKSLNEEGIRCYQDFISIWDNIFPLLYGTMYIFFLSLIYRKTTIKFPKFRLINLFPIIPAGLDWLENVFELRLVNHFAEWNNLIVGEVTTASFFSQLKWGGSAVNYIIIVIGLILLIIDKLTAPKSS